MMLAPHPAWRLESDRGTQVLDARVLTLLRAIGEHGTLVAAARSVGVPYRTAWAVIEASGRTLKAPLVELERGRGATLTPLARRWLAADDEASRVLSARVEALAVDTSASAGGAAVRLLKIAASHDIALAQLRDRWRVRDGVSLEFHGSADSLERFRGGRVELAGFHVALDAARDDPLLARLDADKDALVRFLTREQGLMLPRGNPKRVRRLADLATRRIAIVNRQPGSGTRLLLDRLLGADGIAPGEVVGYSNEEFTHAAVAATVASNRAEAGFGIRAAAAQFGLAFVPLLTERYLFACRRRHVESQRIRAFRDLLSSSATRAIVSPLAGYALDAPGTLLPLGSNPWRRRSARTSARA